jgi:hypothetical protein
MEGIVVSVCWNVAQLSESLEAPLNCDPEELVSTQIVPKKIYFCAVYDKK